MLQSWKTDLRAMESKVMAPKGVEPKIKTRLNAESYKIRKRLSFDNFDNIVVLEKIKKVTFFFLFKYLFCNCLICFV